MIKLIKSTFYNESDTKQKLAEFITRTEILSMGEECRRFEQNFAYQQGRKFAVMVNSGSSANLVVIQALLNIGRLKIGDTIGVSALTWATNIMPLIQLGLKPIAIDCELDTLNVSPTLLKPHLKEIKGLFLTNVLGFADDIAAIGELCKEEGIIFLEDNCESLGSVINGRLLGNFGMASTFSFFVGHHMSTIEGGMICTDDEELYQMMIMVRSHGWDRGLSTDTQQKLRDLHEVNPFLAKYTFYDLAFNVRPTEINGFVGNIQLPYWNEIVASRAQNFKVFQAAIAANDDFMSLKLDHMGVISNFAVPVICHDQATFLTYRRRFEESKIEIRPIIAGDMTQQPFFQKYVPNAQNCPNSAIIHRNGFYFGNNPDLDDNDKATILATLTPSRQQGRPIASTLSSRFWQQPQRTSARQTSEGVQGQVDAMPAPATELAPNMNTSRDKVAFITGITGQDGSYLAELLLEKGYEVHGLVRRASTFNRERIQHLFRDPHERKHNLMLHYGDLSDASSLHSLIRQIKPNEIYHLGAQSHVRVSFDIPEYTGDTVGLSTSRLLEAVRQENPNARFYQASSSEMYGLVQEVPQSETTPFYPRSPYGAAKVYGYWMAVNYRESYSMFACNGILFNHESPRRGESFVTRKITLGLAKILSGEMTRLYMGNLEARRDWGYAKDYVEGMWRMLQQDRPDDYVLATGETHSIRDFIEEACRLLEIDLEWQGEGREEKGIDRNTGKILIEIDSRYFRPAEVDLLIGDPSKAKNVLKWQPKTTFRELVKIMLEADLQSRKLRLPASVRSEFNSSSPEVKIPEAPRFREE